MTNGLNSNQSTTRQHNLDDKSRKFRWSTCFSFVTGKLGKALNKLAPNQQIRLSQPNKKWDKKHVGLLETIDVLKIKPSYSTSSSSMIIWNHPQLHQQPTPLSLSPPPRQNKSKRDSYNTAQAETTVSRRPLVDPTLTPRVKPLSTTKSKKQPSLLRLSMDAELLTPNDVDNDSFIAFKNMHATPAATAVPFRSGTLGATRSDSVSSSSSPPPPPPLPPPVPPLNISLVSGIMSNSRPHSQVTTTDSPISTTITSDGDDDDDDDDNKEQRLSLIERRRRRTPLTMPDTDQLTLALEERSMEEQRKPLSPLPSQSQKEDISWRQHLLEQSIAFPLHGAPSQDAVLLALQSKKVRAVSLQPIAHIRELDDHFEQDTDNGIVRDKAQYEAIVASTTTPHRHSLSYQDKTQPRTFLRARSPPVAPVDMEPKRQEQQQLEIITENEIAMCRTPTSASNRFPASSNTLLWSTTPETPAYLKQTAPSLISAPSTPNSIDSSVIEQDDYMSHQKHQMSHFTSH